MRKAVIIINGYSLSEHQKHQLDRMIEEFAKLKIEAEVVKGNSVCAYVEKGEVKCSIGKCDFVLFLDKDVHLSYMLEKCGYKLFNSAKSIELCDDKMKTYVALSNAGIKMPTTISSPLMYRESEDLEFLRKVKKILPFPIIVKQDYGSLGKEVYLASNEKELTDLYLKLKQKPHLYQKFIGKGGEDIRVSVVGGKAICAMKRTNLNDFRSNIELGGKGSVYEMDEKLIEIAEKCAKVLGLDYCGLDLLIGDDGYYVCEVNSNAFFGGVEGATGKNVAKAYAERIAKIIYS